MAASRKIKVTNFSISLSIPFSLYCIFNSKYAVMHNEDCYISAISVPHTYFLNIEAQYFRSIIILSVNTVFSFHS